MERRIEKEARGGLKDDEAPPQNPNGTSRAGSR
ncbi:hypothetical protein ABH991_008489 [Bradyrhizobium ottawaense]|uniref:Uncharacterized protein n=1 Tax=Bradyrhizobium yuanmingense TaxID=108015 RepID=A0ABV4G6W6_9BRAD